MSKRTPQKVGTATQFVRISSLPMLFKCSWSWAMRDLDYFEDIGGVAAQTGTAVGRMIELWHAGREINEAIALTNVESIDGAEGGERHPFPDYNVEESEEMFRAYAGDPRNKVDVVGQELEVRLELPPHDWDPTGLPIILVGHIDQIRVGSTIKTLWDVKSGRPSGPSMLNDYALQQAAYLLALNEPGSPFAPVEAGGIIRTRDYKKRDKTTQPQVFYRYDWMSLRNARSVVDAVRLKVAALRRCEVDINPGSHCGYCPAGGPFGCLDQLNS